MHLRVLSTLDSTWTNSFHWRVKTQAASFTDTIKTDCHKITSLPKNDNDTWLLGQTVKYSYKTLIIHGHWHEEQITNNSHTIKFINKRFSYIYYKRLRKLKLNPKWRSQKHHSFGWHTQKSEQLKLQYTKLFSDLKGQMLGSSKTCSWDLTRQAKCIKCVQKVTVTYKRCWKWMKEPQWVKTELNNHTLYRYCTSNTV
jgi:hypothetical protein